MRRSTSRKTAIFIMVKFLDSFIFRENIGKYLKQLMDSCDLMIYCLIYIYTHIKKIIRGVGGSCLMILI